MVIWLIPIAAGLPWLAGIAYFWRSSRPQDGSLPPSMGELALKRLSTL